MEREGKRKRAVVDGGSRRRTDEQDKVIAQSALPPTEEEVEEFFAILRRMHVAVKYFKKSNVGLGGRTLTEKLETEALPVVEAENDGVLEVVNGNVSHVVLDLNKIPEGE